MIFMEIMLILLKKKQTIKCLINNLFLGLHEVKKKVFEDIIFL